MPKTVACIIARTVSSRLPLKILRNVSDECSMLDYIIQRVKLVKEVDEVFLCTSTEAVDDIIEDIAVKNKVSIYRGSAEAVIERMLEVGKITNADNLIRITGDNVFTAYEYLGQQIKLLNDNSLDYIRIINVPIGATAEVISRKALERCYASMDPDVSEYLMLFIFRPEMYKCGVIEISDSDYSNLSLTVDNPIDLDRTRSILSNFENEKRLSVGLKEIIQTVIEKDIPGSKIQNSGTIKLPYGKVVSFEEFQNDMKNRIAKSLSFKLE